MSAPSPAFEALQQFATDNSRATLLLNVAAADYASSRCLLLNGLLTGLVLGAQAIEKFLKAYLLLHDPARPVKKISHALPVLLSEAGTLYPNLALAQFTAVAAKFGRHYDARYPDNPTASKSIDLLPNLPSFIRRFCSGYAPLWGVLRTRLV